MKKVTKAELDSLKTLEKEIKEGGVEEIRPIEDLLRRIANEENHLAEFIFYTAHIRGEVDSSIGVGIFENGLYQLGREYGSKIEAILGEEKKYDSDNRKNRIKEIKWSGYGDLILEDWTGIDILKEVYELQSDPILGHNFINVKVYEIYINEISDMKKGTIEKLCEYYDILYRKFIEDEEK